MKAHIATLCIGIGMVSAPPAAATVFRVPQDFALIQTAVDSAQTGDTVLLGTLRDSVVVEVVSVIGKSLVFMSKNGPRRTQIKRRFVISNPGSSDTTKLLGIRWNSGSGNSPIFVDDGKCLIQNCVFDSTGGCSAWNGTTILLKDNADVTVRQCTFVAQPNAITCQGSSAHISSCIFTRGCNFALYPQHGYVSAEYCCFWDNDVIADSSVDWGAGNIPFAPLLREPDLALMPGSPCIDAGDPLLPLDQDGSRADMGAKIPYRAPGRLYVSTSGDDDSADGSMGNPYGSMDMAYFCAIQNDSIVMLPGTHAGHLVIDRTDVCLTSEAGAENTWITGTETDRPIVDFRAGAGNRSTISHLTIANSIRASGILVRTGNRPAIEQCVFSANTPYQGGGVQINADSVTVYGCLFDGNVATIKGGGVLSGGAEHTVIDSCVFRDNQSGDAGSAVVLLGGTHDALIARNVIYHNSYGGDRGGPVYLEGATDVTIHNNSICENTASNPDGQGAGIAVYNSTGIDIRNNLIYNNQGYYGVAALGASLAPCYYNNVIGNWAGEYWGVAVGPGAISAQPLTAGYTEHYRLLPGSPCIDAGDPAMPVPYGGGSIIDIGALEYQYPVGFGDSGPGVVAFAFALRANFPNPFNAETRVAYALPRPTAVVLTIYDALGRHVRTLVESTMPAGEHSVTWNGTDSRGRAVGSGVYFYRLDAGGLVDSRRMLLLK